VDAKRKYLLSATLAFSLVLLITFTSITWPSGIHTTRDFVGFLLLVVLTVSAGLLFSAVTWIAIKGWFEK
jgi:hypothetical protein